MFWINSKIILLVVLLQPVLSQPSVQLGSTTIVGLAPQSIPLLEYFQGIPFAEPPTGSLRFAPPVAKQQLGVSEFNATQSGASCAQFIGTFLMAPSPDFVLPSVSEDCLSINILRPAGLNSSSQLPVMVWVYGGGFILGAAAQFNGSRIVTQSIERGTPAIFVSMNYRLGPLGFPQGSEALSKGALNLGLKDILLGLEWVQNNIGAFGGDNQKVTVFGESSGAIAIAQLYLNSDFGKYARAAILQSGSAATMFTFDALRREDDWQSFVSQVPECANAVANNTFDCLRTANLSTIVAAGNFAYGAANEELPFVPTIDGPVGVIPDFPSKLFAEGHFAQIPFIAGTCLDEGTAFIPPTFNSSQQFNEWLTFNTSPPVVPEPYYQQVIATLGELYPDDPALGSPFGTGNDTFGLSSQYKRIAAALADMQFQSQRRAWTQVASNAGVKVFGYIFADPQPNNPPSIAITHGSDTPYVFGRPLPFEPFEPASPSLSENMIDYWISFATSLDPNDHHGNTSRPNWTQYTPHSQVIMQLQGGNTTMIPDTYREKQIAFINSNLLALRH